MIGDWILDNSGKVIVALIALLVVAMFMAAKTNAEARKAFMAECTQHRENYECIAMWRAGEKNNTYIPVVIPVR